MRLILHLLGVEVLDIQLGRIVVEDVADADDQAFEFAPDTAPLVQEAGRPNDALVGFYQPAYTEDPDEDRRHR